MGKQSKKKIMGRRKRMVQEVLGNLNISEDKLAELIINGFEGTTKEIATREIRFCKDILECISPFDMQQLWKDSLVGERLRNEESLESKKALATKVVDLLKRNEDTVYTLILGTGTTLFRVAEQVLEQKSQLQINTIYTSNILVLNAYLFCRPHGVKLHIVEGQLDLETGWLRSKAGVENLKKQPVDATITSFSGLCKQGFRTDQEYEVEDKFMNLCPHEECKLVIIPLDWSKIGRNDGSLVRGRKKVKNPEDVLDFLEDKKGQRHRRYIILTDIPSAELGGEKDQLLQYWGKKGVEIVRV